MYYVLTELRLFNRRNERSACLGNHVCRWQNFVILISLVSLSLSSWGEIIIHSRQESHRLVVDLLLVTYGEKEAERPPEDGLDILVAAAGRVDECYRIISQTKVTHFRNESDSRQNLQTEDSQVGKGGLTAIRFMDDDTQCIK